MADRDAKIGLGDARCPGPGWEELLAADTRTAPEFLSKDAYHYLGSQPIDPARYTSPAFFARELEHMWPNVWQFAAREEEMPEPGDNVVYDNAGRSYLLVRQANGDVKAFHNVCLHRGRKLRTESGVSEKFECPYHGFTWSLEGKLAHIPCRWDFDHLKTEEMSLPEAQVGRWGGYIFVRENADGPSLEEFLAPLPDHFNRWQHEDVYTAIWVGKVVHANWKATMEAFMEAWHSVVTHPQILPFTGDANTRYNVYGDHINVAYTPFATPSPHLDPATLTQQGIVEAFLQYNGRDASGPGFDVTVPAGETARKTLAESMRQLYAKTFNRDYSHATDAEMLDAFTYNVFPNFGPWGGFMPNICYRWRPWPNQDHTLMEVRILVRVKAGEPTPRSVPMHFLTDDEPWSAAKELGALGGIFDQDMTNLPQVQEGMKASKNRQINLGNYQEIRVRHFHQTIDKYLARFEGK